MVIVRSFVVNYLLINFTAQAKIMIII